MRSVRSGKPDYDDMVAVADPVGAGMKSFW